jgi:hypothetical protein
MATSRDEKEKATGAENTQATQGADQSPSSDGKGRGARYGLRGPARVASEEFGGPIIGFVCDTLTGTLRATGTVANDAVEIVRDVLTGAVHATEEVGTETLGAVGTLGNGVVTTAREILVGGVGGVRDILGSAMPLRRGSAREEGGGTREREAAGKA